MNNQHNETNYRWCILALATLTNTFVAAVPVMCMSVLFKEVSTELNLTLVQVGLIWGIGSLPSIFSVLLWGTLGDRFGPKRILILGCGLIGLLGALRGLAFDFATLMAAVLLLGIASPLVTMNTIKCCGIWFPRRQLGLANGVLSMGMALGFMLASVFSATVLSPRFGGWQHVLFFYGAIAVAFSIPWLLIKSTPKELASGAPETIPMLDALLHVARVKKVWGLGLIMIGVGGCIQGTLGYLPLYLRGLGWPAGNADGAASMFHAASMLFVIPIALWSDWLGSRRKVLLLAVLAIGIGTGSLAIADGNAVWIAIIIAGMVRDGFMGVFITLIIETEGIGATYAGTATGLVMGLGVIGNLIAPAVGNSLAGIAPGLPFVPWATLALASFLGLYAMQERSAQSVLVGVE